MLIGRDKEILTLREAAERDEAQLIAVYGRRRVGKTYLIRETFQGRILFSHAGVYRGSREVQLRAFYESLLEAGLPTNTFQPKDWMEAFVLLRTVIRTSTQQQKIIFLDELSWMDTARSDLMMALEHFWNAWASARKDVVVILCSSATSWMLNKVMQDIFMGKTMGREKSSQKHMVFALNVSLMKRLAMDWRHPFVKERFLMNTIH